MELFFDTETTGKPKRYDAPISDVDNYPRLVQLGYVVTHEEEVLIEEELIVRPVGFVIPTEASDIHGITQEIAEKSHTNILSALQELLFWVSNVDSLIGHNVSFDVSVIGAECWRIWGKSPLEGKKTICTMKSSTDFVGIPGKYGKMKYPKLSELYAKLFGEEMGAAHTALQDIQNTVKCYHELVKLGVIK